MRITREILRQKWVFGLSNRAVAAALSLSSAKVWTAFAKAKAAGLTWDAVQQLSDEELTAALYAPAPGADIAGGRHRPLPDFGVVHAERKKKGVTLALLHLEYLEQHPDGYRYSQFCDYYRAWLAKRKLTMRQPHHAGDAMFVDYSGKRPTLIDSATGEPRAVELFVAVLGASSYTYAEATYSQQGRDFIASHQRAFAFFGGVPTKLVPDQLKSGVTTACRYEPRIQRTYEDMATHYGTTVVPARPAHPRDKAKVEVAVQVAQRWILACLRHQRFFTLDALNERIAELLVHLNARTMRVYGQSRRAMFEHIEAPALRPLPTTSFAYGEFVTATVNIDYHIDVDRHYYSVPYQLVGEKVEARITGMTIEVFHARRRVASHLRSADRGRHTTDPAHMPESHKRHLAWTPSRILQWAGSIGPSTHLLAQAILQERRHPEQGFRACLGIFRLGKKYGDARLEAACGRALQAKARSYRNVDSILKRGLDKLAQPSAAAAAGVGTHEHIRGQTYYSEEITTC